MTQRNDKVLTAFYDEVQKLGGISTTLFEDKKGELLKRLAAQQDGSRPIGSNHQTREMTQGAAYDRSSQGGRQQEIGSLSSPSSEVVG